MAGSVAAGDDHWQSGYEDMPQTLKRQKLAAASAGIVAQDVASRSRSVIDDSLVVLQVFLLLSPHSRPIVAERL